MSMAISAIHGTTLRNHYTNTVKNTRPANNYAYVTFQHQSNDTFVKQKHSNISFKGYDRAAAQQFIEQIEQSKAKHLARGWQCEFYKINDEIGIKAPKPLHPEYQNADFNGYGNVKEFFALKKINEISPDIAVTPYEIINKNGKNYLVEEVLTGGHPYKTQLTKGHVTDILNKAFTLDTNGIVNNDLQGGNIILTGKDKTKFIDFGSFSILENSGHYINSDIRPAEQYQNGTIANLVNSTKEGRFMATFYSDYQPDFLMRSDNKFLKMDSNATVFEYRTIYDYLKTGHDEKPKDFFSNYLKIKSEQYHDKMIEFLESLKLSKTDKAQLDMRKNAVEQEKIFKEVFANPSENVMKAELGKMQLKWLVLCHGDQQHKTFSYFQDYLNMINTLEQNAQGTEKKYFASLKERISALNFEHEVFKGRELADDENLIKIIFENVKAKAKETINKATQDIIEIIEKPSPIPPEKAGGKKTAALLGLTGILAAGSVYAYKNINEKKQKQPELKPRVLAQSA